MKRQIKRLEKVSVSLIDEILARERHKFCKGRYWEATAEGGAFVKEMSDIRDIKHQINLQLYKLKNLKFKG